MPRRCKLGTIDTATNYAIGCKTISTDLRAIVKLLGLDRTVMFARVLEKELMRDATVRHGKVRANKISNAPELAKSVKTQIERVPGGSLILGTNVQMMIRKELNRKVA